MNEPEGISQSVGEPGVAVRVRPEEVARAEKRVSLFEHVVQDLLLRGRLVPVISGERLMGRVGDNATDELARLVDGSLG